VYARYVEESDTQLFILDEENREENMFESDTFHDSLRAHKKAEDKN